MHTKRKKKLKVLHLASFLGNIGDHANHQGFYSLFLKKIPADVTQLEIRKFYNNRKEMQFDDSFVRMVNSYDLLILGGGGFFDLQWDYSHTATTIDFSEKVVEAITIPVLVNAMGYHEYGQVDRRHVARFGAFLQTISNKPNWFVSVRNDGSFERLQARYTHLLPDGAVHKVPDSGFLYTPKNLKQCQIDAKSATWIGFSITNDLFQKKFNGTIDPKIFNAHMGTYINTLLARSPSYRVLLFPHAHQDIATISEVLSHIDDKYRRERVSVAPLCVNAESIDVVFDLYRACTCIVGMRFHANVCAIGMGIPTIGLAGHEQIVGLYRELGLSDRCIVVSTPGFVRELDQCLKQTIRRQLSVRKKYKDIRAQLVKKSQQYIRAVGNWVDSF